MVKSVSKQIFLRRYAKLLFENMCQIRAGDADIVRDITDTDMIVIIVYILGGIIYINIRRIVMFYRFMIIDQVLVLRIY